jgi:mono/diheme cytochrome c family protein
MKRPLALLIALASAARAEDKTTYDDHVFPIFQQSCLNCHNPDKTKGGLDLSTFSGAIKGSSGGKIVEPGDPGTALITCVQQTGEHKMPPEGEKLSSDKIDILKRWIEGGLLENKSSSARKPSKPKFETALRSDPAAKPEGPPPMPADLLLEPPVVTQRPSTVHSIAASPWAPVVAITGQHQVLLHHTGTLELIGILPFPEGDPVSLSFTPDARYLIVGGGVPGKSGVTVTFDIRNGTRLLTVAKEFDSVLAADIRPGFDIIATGGPSRLLKLWNTESGAQIKSVKRHTDWITALDFSPDGVLLASGDRNGGLWVWESDSCNEFQTLRGHQAAITATVFRADSNILASSSEDGTIRFWEMNGGSEVKKIDAHPGGVTAFAFCPDGSFVTAGRDMKAKFWKSDFNIARDLVQNLTAMPTAVALDFEAKRAFVADCEGVVHVYQTSDGKPVGEIQANPPTVESRLVALRTQISQQEKSPDEKSPPLAALKDSLKRWTAAEINTRAISAHREAEENALATDENQLNFTRSAASIAERAEVLNKKRSQREELANLDKSGLTAEIAAEVDATLTAVDIRISMELEALQKAENDTLTAAQAVDGSAPLATHKKREFESLSGAYHKALE